MTIDVLICAGTGFSRGGDGVCEDFAKRLDKSRFNPVWVEYPADYGLKGRSFHDSLTFGELNLHKALSESDNPAVLAGYSQGAACAGNLAKMIGEGMYPECDVRAVALIADPFRDTRNDLYASDPTGYGIAGKRRIDGIPCYSAAVVGDPISALPAGNPLRSIADLSDYFSLSNPGDAVAWGWDMYNDAVKHRMQRWWSLENWRSWSGALTYANNYLFLGKHTNSYVTEGHTRRLADALNQEVFE